MRFQFLTRGLGIITIVTSDRGGDQGDEKQEVETEEMGCLEPVFRVMGQDFGERLPDDICVLHDEGGYSDETTSIRHHELHEAFDVDR